MDDKIYECPECNDTGYILVKNAEGHEYAVECKCRAIKTAKVCLEHSGLARQFQKKTFETFDTCNNEQLIDAKNTAISFTNMLEDNRLAKKPSLILCGQVGAGKTHLGTASSTELINKGIAVIYMGYREEMTSLKSKIMNEDAYSKEIERYKKAQVLFIDDFLKGKITDSDINIVYEIINYRYNNNLPIIVSTEKTLDDLINFDEAIASRIIEMCYGNIIVFSGKELNYRLYRGGVA